MAKDTVDRVCPVVTRIHTGQQWDLLAFEHPLAGFQLVKGRVEAGESPERAACRELREESGLICRRRAEFLFSSSQLPDQGTWHLFLCSINTVPQKTWTFTTEDDGGRSFRFFWHSTEQPLDERWHPLYHRVFAMLLPRLAVRLQR